MTRYRNVYPKALPVREFDCDAPRFLLSGKQLHFVVFAVSVTSYECEAFDLRLGDHDPIERVGVNWRQTAQRQDMRQSNIEFVYPDLFDAQRKELRGRHGQIELAFIVLDDDCKHRHRRKYITFVRASSASRACGESISGACGAHKKTWVSIKSSNFLFWGRWNRR